MKGVLSKSQRERKKRRAELSAILGKRQDDWTQFIKKDTEKNMTEEERDKKEGDKLVAQMDPISDVVNRYIKPEKIKEGDSE